MPRARTVFVSCGQLTDPERKLGRDIARVIEGHDMRAFIAQEVHSAGDLNTEVFRALQTCDAFLAILQRRGIITFTSHPPKERSSVWIQQEFAVFCYRMFLEQRSLPIRIYTEQGIRQEGVMEIAVANPITFDRGEEVLAGVDAWLKSREFEEHPILARREELFRSRIGRLDQDQLIVLELIAAHCLQPDDFAFHHIFRDDFFDIARSVSRNLQDEEIDKRFNEAYSHLVSLGLVMGEGQPGFATRVWIAKQWWQLVHDELRNRGKAAVGQASWNTARRARAARQAATSSAGSPAPRARVAAARFRSALRSARASRPRGAPRAARNGSPPR